MIRRIERDPMGSRPPAPVASSVRGRRCRDIVECQRVTMLPALTRAISGHPKRRAPARRCASLMRGANSEEIVRTQYYLDEVT
jgi:hypothetical protein